MKDKLETEPDRSDEPECKRWQLGNVHFANSSNVVQLEPCFEETLLSFSPTPLKILQLCETF